MGETLESSNIKKIREFFEKRKINYFSDFTEKDKGKVLATLPISKLGLRAEKGKLSKRQIHNFQRRVEVELGIEFEIFTFKEKEQEEIEVGLCGLLREIFKDNFIDCSLSFLAADEGDVWVRFKSSLTQSTVIPEREIRRRIADYFKVFGKTLKEVHFEGSFKESPSKMAILRQIKISEPVQINELKSQLVHLGFEGVSLSWLENKLDLLRKQEMLLRSKDRSYALTGLGLKIVPHGKYRTSSDIERVLALGRRKW